MQLWWLRLRIEREYLDLKWFIIFIRNSTALWFHTYCHIILDIYTAGLQATWKHRTYFFLSLCSHTNNGAWHKVGIWCMFTCCHCSVSKPCPTLCDLMDFSTLCFPVLHYFPEFAQIHVPWAGDAIQPPHSMSPSSLALKLSQHQGLFQWDGSSHQVAKVLEFHVYWLNLNF